MKKLLILLFSILISFNSYGAGDESTRYVYEEFNIDNASKYTISTGDMHEWACLFNQVFYFMNIDNTPTSINLYKKKVYWVDMDLNTKIKNNFVKLQIFPAPEQLFELMHKDNELIFRIETPHEGSTLVCDFPFKELTVEDSKEDKLYDEELDEDGYPIQTICWGWDLVNDVVILKDGLVFLKNRSQPFTGKNLCKYENGQIEEEGSFKDGESVGKWTNWYENGQKWKEGNWKDNTPEGKWTWWYKNGQKWKEGSYSDCEFDQGKCTMWYDTGQMMSDGSNNWYRDGKLKKNSKKKAEIYSKDGYDIIESWNHQGQKTSVIKSKEGNLISETKYDYHYSNSSKKSVRNFNNNGKLHGKYTSWFKSGKAQLDANYKDGNEDGNYTLSFEDGRVIERVYKDGKCISGDC
jgi:antitoxin component YwqK of YwqJK toxin-antitoxin module